MMHWTTVKLSMAIVGACFALGIGGVALTSAIETHAPAAQATSLPTVDPATAEPASDAQSIQSTLALFVQALRTNDVKTLDQCIAITNDDKGVLLKSMLLDNMATRHLQDAWAAKFHKPMEIPNLSFIWFPAYDGGMEVLIEKTLANLDPSEIQITGTVARVPYKFAPRILSSDPTNGFASAWLTLIKDGPTWKLDINNTLLVRLWLQFRPHRQPRSTQMELQAAAAFKVELAKLIQDAAAQIESGKLATVQAAARKILNETLQLFARQGLNSASFGVQPASPMSTENGG